MLHHLLQESEFWVLVSFIIFLGVLYSLGLHKRALIFLDERTQRIINSLDQAKKTREEAQALLAHCQRQYQGMQDEVKKIRAEAHKTASAQKAHMDEHLQNNVAHIKNLMQARMVRLQEQAIERMMHDIQSLALAVAEKIIKEQSGQGQEGKVSPFFVRMVENVEKQLKQGLKS